MQSQGSANTEVANNDGTHRGQRPRAAVLTLHQTRMEEGFNERFRGIVSSQAPHSKRFAQLLLTSMPSLSLNLNLILNFKLIAKSFVSMASAYEYVRSGLNRHGGHLGQKVPQCTT